MIEYKGPCPVCSQATINKYLRRKCVQPGAFDLDGRPKDYMWADNYAPHVPPHYLFIAYCPHCYFADILEDYRNPDARSVIEKLVKDRVNEVRGKSGILKALGEFVDTQGEEVSYSSTLLIHLLAIYIQELLPPNIRPMQKIGRLYLRTAWLYRESGEQEPSQFKKVSFNERPSLCDYLKEVKKEWPELPISEEASMRKAMVYYEHVTSDDVKEDVQILLLISNILRILSEYPRALSYLERADKITKAQQGKHIRLLDQNREQASLSSKQEAWNKQQLDWFKNQNGKIIHYIKDVKDAIWHTEAPKAREILGTVRRQKPEEITGKLLETGLHQVTVQRILAENLRARPDSTRHKGNALWRSFKEFLDLE